MKRIEIPVHVTYRYRVLNGSDKRGFRISKFEGDVFLATVKDARLEAINAQFKKSELTKTQAREKVDLLVESLYKSDGVRISRVSDTSSNEKWVEAQFKKIYSKRQVVDKEAALSIYLRAVRCLGELSIHTASLTEMQDAVNEKYPDHRQRPIVGALNTVLKWADRTEQLEPYPKKKFKKRIRHMPFDKIEDALKRIDDPAFCTMVRMAMYTGCRIGELFALTPTDLLNKRVIRVDKQIDKYGELTGPKWGSERTVAPFPQAVELYAQWMKDKSKVDHDTRLRASKIFKSACRRAHPNNKAYWLCFHDLRHCFAVASVELGEPIDLVAKNLGNDPKITLEYYAGKVHTDVTLDASLAFKAAAVKKEKKVG